MTVSRATEKSNRHGDHIKKVHDVRKGKLLSDF